MTTVELLQGQFEREVDRSRRVMAAAPDGRGDWKPHDRSMEFGRLAYTVASMPSWVALAIKQDELDLAPPGGSQHRPTRFPETSQELLAELDRAAADGRAALRGTTDDFLMTPWRLLVAGTVVMETPRHEVIADTLAHLSHHRGQLTVYLRLMGEKVPAIFGPSADDQRFA
jgi:uncharacterized damage-inducible protein DinB